MSEYCVIFMNHTPNMEKFNIIKNKCDELDVDCVNLNPDWEELHEKYEEYWFNSGEATYVGNCFFPIWDFKDKHPEYKYFMFLEYDVNFTGDWGYLINKFKVLIPDHIDYIMQDRPRAQVESPEWYWWGLGKYIEDEWINSHLLCNIYAMTSEVMDEIIRMYHRGMNAHHEAVIGTALRQTPKLFRSMMWPSFFKCYLDYIDTTWVNTLEDGIIPEDCLYHPDVESKI